MPLELSTKELRQIVSAFHFATDGDLHERQYWPIIKERFPNCERFWKFLVVPTTKRIERPPEAPDRIERREDVADDLWKVCYLHYSLFLHLVAAHEHLSGTLESSFGDFYTHLGSACDLTEQFILRMYIVVAECTGQKIKVLQTLSRKKFLALAAEWYDEHYRNVYEHYLKYGQGRPPIPIPSRNQAIREYYAGRKEWKAYTTFVQNIKAYRNVIVHDVLLGNVLMGRVRLVPRKERIQQYRGFSKYKMPSRSRNC